VKIAIVGAGIIGVTTAYELVGEGHEVVVFERRGSVAAETSFANAGVVAPGYVTPWAAPGMPRKVLGQLFDTHASVRFGSAPSVAEMRWMWRWWRACRLRTYQANRLQMQRLALFSRERLHRITREHKFDYERSEGYLVLLRDARDMAMVRPGLDSLAQLKTRFELLDPGQCRAVEPGLSNETALHGGVYLPDDEVGNCRQFAMLLRAEAQRLGVLFRFHTQVRRILPGRVPQLVHQHAPPRLAMTAVDTAPHDAGDTRPMAPEPVAEGFDAVVVCAALGSDALLRPHGLALPLIAVHGYSITAPLRRIEAHPDHGPRSALMDERYKVAISRLGARVRIAGSAEIGGSPARNNPKALDTLYRVLHDWFPGAVHLSQAQVWKGARPMLPDGPPVLGRSGIEGVWLNLGHGSSGWALACGSARVLADSIAGRAPPVSVDGFGVERLRG
jgi:D-amino-acid dehydrogenase